MKGRNSPPPTSSPPPPALPRCLCPGLPMTTLLQHLLKLTIFALLVCPPSLVSPMPVGSSSSGMQQVKQRSNNGSCPSMCECPGDFYVYCQSAGLKDHHVTQIVSQISTSVVLLDLSSNQIAKIQPKAFERLTNLQYLYLSANQIGEIPTEAFRCLFALKQLTLQSNRISAVHEDSFFDLIRIQTIDLSINNLSRIPPNTFSNLKTLEKLHLQHNAISELQANVFSGLTNLELLNISHNAALNFTHNNSFAGLSKLRTLDLSHNSLLEFSGSSFNGLTSLSVLDLGHNLLSDVTFLGNSDALKKGAPVMDFQSTLTELSLAGNRLRRIPSRVFPSLPSLKRLDLSNNSLTVVEPEAFETLLLEKLSLRGNLLVDLDRDAFSGVRRVSELDLAQNRFSAFSARVFDSFRVNSPFSIDLSENKLTYIHSALFREMATLRVLNLSRNEISVVDAGALDDLRILEDLDLSGNRLTSVTPHMVSGPAKSLRKLRLVDNPLEQIQGFSFYQQTDHIRIETEARVESIAPTWVTVTWPYRDGSQLYWSLLVTCDLPSSSLSSTSHHHHHHRRHQAAKHLLPHQKTKP
ncbi:hypothetical protein EGW08_020962 [Elysia chlorotica]|uniref:LRRNT domain-containing protein n=1 Tax=Elysia chlorotica TaxID=188477 RepID=A0A3S0ZBP0_ELYCH|nr:hypothetical protein EGW08_020962 [Elysia chlorotica]